MHRFLCLAFCLSGLNGICQNVALISNNSTTKPPLDTSIFRNWISVKNAAISNNGAYACYLEQNKPIGQKTLVVKGIATGKKIEIINADQAKFSDDSRRLIFLKAKDSLGILNLENENIEYKTQVRYFRLFNQGGVDDLMAFLSADSLQKLILINLVSNQVKKFDHVKNYRVSNNGYILLLQLEELHNGYQSKMLRWVDLRTNESFPVWYSSAEENNILIESVTFNLENDRIAFINQERIKGNISYSLWYFDSRSKLSVLLADKETKGIDRGFRFAPSRVRFSNDGNRIFLSLKKEEVTSLPNPDAVMSDVWSFQDSVLQSQQLNELQTHRIIDLAVTVSLLTKEVIKLQNEGENIDFFDKTDDIAIIKQDKKNIEEQNWNKTAKPLVYLVFTKTGEKRMLPWKIVDNSTSPTGKYILVADQYWRQFYYYEINTGKVGNLTSKLPIPLIDEELDDNPLPKSRGIEFLAWFKNECAILIRDKYDLWKLDVTGKKLPINITNGYGRKNKITFRLIDDIKSRLEGVTEVEQLLLFAFNEENKNNGFFRVSLNKKEDPELLTMGPYIYSMPKYPGILPEYYPIKAKDKNVWLVKRESVKESPNYFWTNDLKRFLPISDCYPEYNYNWVSSELISFKSRDGKHLKGVLYKPENFDFTKRYPVIIHYYEKLSHKLNVYEGPELTGADINIPWFVSNGYLVFTTDIKYTIGYPGMSAFNCILGAANYLSKQSFVGKMGIQGHSWGGYETNYVVTHTNKFAAAMSSCGVSDFIHGYGTAIGDGKSKGFFYETHQSRIGPTPWERPDLYIKNSPIFYASKVRTPILLMSNKLDGAVSFDQGVSFFLALRRLGKRAWMLQYDGSGHGVRNENAKVLHTIRIMQFFDHYLKEAPAPKWMTNGIPAKLKGIDDGLDLVREKDANGKWKTPSEGSLLTDQESKKVKELINNRRITVTIE